VRGAGAGARRLPERTGSRSTAKHLNRGILSPYKRLGINPNVNWLSVYGCRGGMTTTKLTTAPAAVVLSVNGAVGGDAYRAAGGLIHRTEPASMYAPQNELRNVCTHGNGSTHPPLLVAHAF
jgi:hypothetical protein